MRKIKFRGKTLDGRWIYGDLWHRPYAKDCVTIVSFMEDTGTTGGLEVIPETVGQYTGLKDKNGEEIYEGDICRLTNTYLGMNTKSTIEIAYEDWAFVGRWPEVESPTGYMVNNLNSYNFPTVIIEVIGNIYENPEMLKEEQK